MTRKYKVSSILIAIRMIMMTMSLLHQVGKNQKIVWARVPLSVTAWSNGYHAGLRDRRRSIGSHERFSPIGLLPFVERETATPSLSRLLRAFATSTSSSPGNNMTFVPESEEIMMYQELQWLSREIRRHDELYYSQHQPELDDDEFDALVHREEELSKAYPHLLQQWQTESGWGEAATRRGRVGTNVRIQEGENVRTLIPESRIKRKHLVPMLSLDNVHNYDQLWAWLKRIPKALDEWNNLEKPIRVTIMTEPKLDGVSLALRYRRQTEHNAGFVLEWASTRGDGQQGQDVTAGVRSMGHTIPQVFSTIQQLPDTIEIRGEAILPNTEFERLPELAPNATFSNARNTASGMLLRKESEVEVDQIALEQLRSKLQFYAYDMVAEPPSLLELDGTVMQSTMADIGFFIPSPVSITELEMFHNETMEDWSNERIAPMLAYYEALQAYRDDPKGDDSQGYDWGDFEMDGCVHKISQSKLRRLLGHSMKSPKWAVAHKFPPRAVVTKLLNVTVQIGRTGAVTPVAVLAPVDIGGVTIQRATLHNFGHLQLILGGKETAVGTSVLVRRAGDVIPQVVQRVGTPLETPDDQVMISLEPPKKCPACDSPVILEKVASTAGVGQVARCVGPPLLCPPRAVTSLAHAFSRDALDVTGLSEARIQQLMDADLLRYPSDLFQFGDDEWNQIQVLPGWGPKSCQNLRKTCQQVAFTGISLSRFLYALGIRHLGKHSSELVASCYVTLDAFWEAVDAASEWEKPQSEQESGELCPVPFIALQSQLGLGPAVFQSLLSFSKSAELVDAAKALGKAIKVIDEAPAADTISNSNGADSSTTVSLPWKGFRVVFTGSIPNFSRTEAHKAAKALGAKATPASVSKSTDLVVYGEKGGKKLEQANSLGIRTITAEEFIVMLENDGESNH